MKTTTSSLPDTKLESQRLEPTELDALRTMGRHWNVALQSQLQRLRALPVDPALDRFPDVAIFPRLLRIARVSMFRREAGDELEATSEALEPVSAVGRIVERVQRFVIGPPLRSSAIVQERMRKLVALPVLSADLLTSVAYGPEAMLSILALAGTSGLALSLPLSGVLVVLMIAIGVSYRQTIAAYPSGAGAYIVAGDNLGRLPGLVAAVGLLFDYLLTVAVSVAAGAAAITSAAPSLGSHAVALGLGAIALLLLGNLRGIREAGYLFAAPTYVFLAAMFLLIGVGLADAVGGTVSAASAPPPPPMEPLTLFLVLRAFSSGATSMTGIEAVSNAIPAFEPPEWRNARTTLMWMVGLLVVLFAGVMLLIHLDGVVPHSHETLLSQLAHRHFGAGVLYAFFQGATAVVLLFAANTAFNAFPRLLYVMATNHHAPRAFSRMGDRLAFSNGVVSLALAASAIFVGFHGDTAALIPLFAVGVFLAVTLSQAGMVLHWWRRRSRNWRRSLAVNAVGAALSSIVLVVAAVTKFTAGAWVVVVGIPLVVWLCTRIRAHYDTVGRALALSIRPELMRGEEADRPAAGTADESARPQAAFAEPSERQANPKEIRHLIVALIEQLDSANLHALAYATSLDQPVLVVHLSPDEADSERFHDGWRVWGVPLRLEIVVSPYRALVAPLAHYVEALHSQRQDLTTTVVLAEVVVSRPWHRLLDSRLAPRLRRALNAQPGIVITSIPFHVFASSRRS